MNPPLPGAWKTSLVPFVLIALACALLFFFRTPLMVAFWFLTASQPPSAAATLTPAENEAIAFAKQYLIAHAKEYSLKSDLSDLQVLRVDFMADGKTVRFQQTYYGIPVGGAGILVDIPPRENEPPQVLNHYISHIIVRNVTPPYPSNNTSILLPRTSSFEAVVRAYDAVKANGKSGAWTELLISPVGRSDKEIEYALTWHVKFYSSDGFQWGVTIDAMTGKILSSASQDIKAPPTPVPAQK